MIRDLDEAIYVMLYARVSNAEHGETCHLARNDFKANFMLVTLCTLSVSPTPHTTKMDLVK
jgi:hypothetical protein